MRLEFQEYRVRKIVNVHRHVDGPWYWDRYSAHPYVGCRSGCEFCYLRAGFYLRRPLDTFDKVIQVKTNAVDRLRKEVARLDPDVILCGDWQRPAEDRYRLSRGMLEVVLDAGFPLFIVERSPLLLRDLDLLQEVKGRTWVGIAFSMSSLDPKLKHTFEPRSPAVRSRLEAMETLAASGILVGMSLMPVLPYLSDSEDDLAEMVRATKDYGGAFVLAGGLTLERIQGFHLLEVLRAFSPDLEDRWRQLYGWHASGNFAYSPPRSYSSRLGRTVRDLCTRHGLAHRVPRYIQPGPLAVNKRVAERLFLKTYEMELEEEDEYRIWAYRKAAWSVDESRQSIADVYAARGEAGLKGLPGIGQGLATEIARWLQELGLAVPQFTETPGDPAR